MDNKKNENKDENNNEDKSNKSEMIERFVNHFTENFNSIISNYFFGMLKEKKTCLNCNMFSYNFGCFCLLTFDLNEICKNNSNNYSLDFLFDAMKKSVLLTLGNFRLTLKALCMDFFFMGKLFLNAILIAILPIGVFYGAVTF